MNKKILIISNPGEPSAENYCEGVNVDVAKYQDFFKTALGGGWYSHEIQHLDRPTKTAVIETVKKLSTLDYSIIIFCGHGWYSSVDNSTVLELKNGQELSEMELRKNGAKRTIILDCCREIYNESILESAMEVFAMERDANLLSIDKCRRFYEKAITKASTGLIVAHACSLDETAGDNSQSGGLYSESLRISANKWRKNNTVSSDNYSILSIVATHKTAAEHVKVRSGGRQNPQMEKPRSLPYYPFAIIA